MTIKELKANEDWFCAGVMSISPVARTRLWLNCVECKAYEEYYSAFTDLVTLHELNYNDVVELCDENGKVKHVNS